MNKEIEKYVNEIYNKQAKEYIENELSYFLQKEIKLPEGGDYLKMFSEVYKTDEQLYEEQIEELQDRIDKAIEYIKDVQHGMVFNTGVEVQYLPTTKELLDILEGKENE